MTTKTISGNYPSGFTLSTKYSGLILTTSASVGGSGVDVLGNASVDNYGRIAASGESIGLYMNKGGTIINEGGGAISGNNAIQSSSTATTSVVNFGSISGALNGVALYGGGYVSNLELIYGAYAGVLGKGTVVNFGSIYGNGSGVNLTTGLVENVGIIGGGNYAIVASGAATVANGGTVGYAGDKVGVDLENGGSLVNGYTNGPGGNIYGAKGVEASAAAVKNYATIISASAGSGSAGVILTNGATLANGTVSDRSALIEGYNTGLAIDSSASRATNFGTIACTGTLGQPAVYVGGGLLTNGGGGDTTAVVKGQEAVGVVSRGTVANLGFIDGTGLSSGDYGIVFDGGGRLTNGSGANHTAKVAGYGGVEVIGGAGSINNYGTIAALGVYHTGVALGDGGEITNGALNDTAASINGYVGVTLGAGGLVANFGTIGGAAARGGIEMTAGGAVTNGAATDQGARIEGLYSVYAESGALTVANFGSIVGLGAKGAISNTGGARVTNGSPGDTSALIQGSTGVQLGGAGTVGNYATIQGLAGAGVSQAGGSVTNGAATDRTATIEGYSGVKIATAAGTVSNFGTIRGEANDYAAGVFLSAGGRVTNGGGADRSALIEGQNGVICYGSATVGNSGTILGDDSAGVDLVDSGSLTNGSLNNAGAQISGVVGVTVNDASVANFGAITGLSDAAGYGVRLFGVSSLTNGTTGHATALIEGYTGLYANAANDTVTNFGTIAGLGGVALDFYPSANDTLVVEAGCAFEGAVLGGGGTLDLGSGTGTISNFGTAALTVSGSMAATTFQGFDTMVVSSGATFTDGGAVTLAAVQTVQSAGALTLGGTGKNNIINAGLVETTGAGALTLAGALTNNGTVAANGGTLTASGSITGSGVFDIGGGTLDVTGAFAKNVTFTGTAGVLELAQSQGYTGTITGFSKTGGTTLDLVDIGFVGSGEATYSGTKTGGVLTVTDGTHTAHINLKGSYLTSTFTASSDGHGGTDVVDPKADAGAGSLQAGAAHVFIAAMAGLGASAALASAHAGATWPAREPTLANPRVAAA
jgi:hypothetical protein